MSNSFKLYPTHFSRGSEIFSRGGFASPALPLVTGLITGQFVVRLKLSSNRNCPSDWTSNQMFYADPLLQKTFDLILIILKNTELQRAARALADEPE